MRLRRLHGPILCALLLLGLAACEDDPVGPTPVSLEDTEFAPELEIDLEQMDRTESGVYYADLIVGDSAQAAEGDSITVHYKLWRHDGTLVFDSHENEEPVDLWLSSDEGGVILGWVEGVPGMRVGGIRKLVVPWEQGYGSATIRDQAGNVVIPAYANLVFEVELLEVTPPAADGEQP